MNMRVRHDRSTTEIRNGPIRYVIEHFERGSRISLFNDSVRGDASRATMQIEIHAVEFAEVLAALQRRQ